MRLEQYTEAESVFEHVLSINIENLDALNGLGAVFANQGEIEKGMNYFDKALEIDSEYASALSNKAAAFRDLGKYDESIRIYDKVLEKDPQNQIAIEGKQKTIEKKLEESVSTIGEFSNIIKSIPWLFLITIIGAAASLIGAIKMFKPSWLSKKVIDTK